MNDKCILQQCRRTKILSPRKVFQDCVVTRAALGAVGTCASLPFGQPLLLHSTPQHTCLDALLKTSGRLPTMGPVIDDGVARNDDTRQGSLWDLRPATSFTPPGKEAGQERSTACTPRIASGRLQNRFHKASHRETNNLDTASRPEDRPGSNDSSRRTEPHSQPEALLL